MYNTKKLREVTLPALEKLLEALPEDVHIDIQIDSIGMQARTQEEVGRIRAALPGLIWHKKWSSLHKWWEYTTEFHGQPLEVYAVREAPKTCTAIVEKRVVKESVPTKYVEREVVQEVIVGWDCGKGTDHETA